MIRSLLFDPETGTMSSGGLDLVDTWKASDRLILWLDMDAEDEHRERAILDDFEIHPLAIQDALRQRHPPKIEQFDNCLFVLLRGLDAKTEGIQFGGIQLALLIGERFLVTRHDKASLSANWLYDTIQTEGVSENVSPGALAVRLSGRLVSRYIQILLDLEPRLDDIEEEMFTDPSDSLLAELTGYKSRLRRLGRIANYHKHVVTTLQRDGSPQVDKGLGHELIDLYEQVERTSSLANLYYEMAKDLTDGYLAMSSHHLNSVMQILTVFTVIFVPLTFLAGVYGMNFQNMPELNSNFGYFIVLGVMALAAILQFTYFKKRGWI